MRTRDCTEVYFSMPPNNHIPVFEVRHSSGEISGARPQIFSSDPELSSKQVSDLAASLLQKVLQRRTRKRRVTRVLRSKQACEKLDHLNRKRQWIAECFIMHDWTVNEIARHTKSGVRTVQRIVHEVKTAGELKPYTYSNLKNPQDLQTLHQLIRGSQHELFSTADIKRKLPGFSKMRIRRELHDLGLGYRRLPRERKRQPAPPDSGRVRRVISHLVQAHSDPETSMLFCDEVKFPLYQTASHAWLPSSDVGTMIYNRRLDADPTVLVNMIALCSTQGFVAVQAFIREVTGPDFVFFLTKVLEQLPQGNRYSILVDNATWHSANVVTKTPMPQILVLQCAEDVHAQHD